MEKMAAAPLAVLRPELLTVKGIGPETADSILLYGLEKPTFVVDAYTFRILSRHGLAADPCTYEELQTIFTAALPPETELYQRVPCLIGANRQRLLPAPAPLCQPVRWRALIICPDRNLVYGGIRGRGRHRGGVTVQADCLFADELGYRGGR